MYRKYYVYLLVKENFDCFKIGITTSIESRLKNLSCYGPFDIKQSKLISLNTKKDIRSWEQDISRFFSHYNLRIETTHSSNGETEWYHMEGFNDILNYLEMTINMILTINEGLISCDCELIKLLQKKNLRQQKYNLKVNDSLFHYSTKKTNKIAFNNISEKFKNLDIIGVDKIEKDQNIRYKILCNKNKDIESFLTSSSFKVTEKNGYSFQNLCNSSIQNSKLSCFTFEFNKNSKILNHWVSKCFTKKIQSFLEEQSNNSIPAQYKDFIKDFEINKDTTVHFTGNQLIDDFLF